MIRKIKNLIKFLLILSIMTVGFHFVSVKADSYDDFVSSGQLNNVISNDYFVNINAMTASDIQAFLTSKGSYLKDYSDNGRSAAQIIWDAAHGKYEAAGTLNGVVIDESTGTINPQVILVYLQKEQSLVSRTTYNEWAMTASMGYQCYSDVSGDNNGNNCKDIYEGFTKQVENGAWQLRYNYEIAGKSSSWWDTYYSGYTKYMAGNTITTSDSYTVTIANQATAAAYRYTPYVFYSAYNVWNLYYNTYDFDTVANGSVGTNDTSAFVSCSYSGSISLAGGKISTSRVYYNENLIADIGTTSWQMTLSPSLGSADSTIVYKDADGNQIATKSIHLERHKTADINGDNSIDLLDLSTLASFWNNSNPSNSFVDLNFDGTVDLLDLSILASNWGK